MTLGRNLYNNIGIEALSIAFVMQKSAPMPLAKIILILPIVAHTELLVHLSRGNVKIQSFERLVIEKISFFSNFNRRFYANLCSSLNALQFLHEIDVIRVENGKWAVDSEIFFDKQMGNRAEKIYKAAPNIAKILGENVDKLYLNLRVEL